MIDHYVKSLTSYTFSEYTWLFFIIDSWSAILLKGISLLRFPMSVVFVPVPSHDIDFQCQWKSMSWLGTGTKTTDIGNLCPGLGQAQRLLTLEIYILAWDGHKDHWHWKSMSWLGTGTKTTDIGNLCPGLGQAQRTVTLEIVSGLCVCPKPGHRFPVSVVFVPVPSQDIDFQCQWSLCLSQVRT
jgi:hypothetical protein